MKQIKNVITAWKYLNWEWKTIVVVGFIALIGLLYNLSLLIKMQ